MAKYYTGIGSRQTPKEILDLMVEIGRKMSDLGYIGRSGGAEGADSAFQEGAQLSGKSLFDVYLPWGKSGHDKNIIMLNPQKFQNYQQAVELASQVHPAWDRCSDAAKKLHSRNVYQILGNDLRTPSKVCILYAEPRGTYSVKGGTNTALQLALMHKVPSWNLYKKESREFICNKLEIQL